MYGVEDKHSRGEEHQYQVPQPEEGEHFLVNNVDEECALDRISETLIEPRHSVIPIQNDYLLRFIPLPPNYVMVHFNFVRMSSMPTPI